MSIGPITLWLALHSGSRHGPRGTELVNKKKRDGYRRMPITSEEFSGPFRVEWTHLSFQPFAWIGVWDQEVGGHCIGELATEPPMRATSLGPTDTFTLEIQRKCPTCGRPEGKRCPTCGGSDD
jgi:hypothetical protein